MKKLHIKNQYSCPNWLANVYVVCGVLGIVNVVVWVLK